ncbi:hypothetical protein FGO68_gene14547 [Halteria grandinella]|uniref:Uncharacterized protein n=1 Tax=Halteria grandinella TaxID=5974 RepID=A0A8J8NC36_HALGN|nr:hypothetical protein FGO68_gene14547 [Halteria grandinella]
MSSSYSLMSLAHSVSTYSTDSELPRDSCKAGARWSSSSNAPSFLSLFLLSSSSLLTSLSLVCSRSYSVHRKSDDILVLVRSFLNSSTCARTLLICLGTSMPVISPRNSTFSSNLTSMWLLISS